MYPTVFLILHITFIVCNLSCGSATFRSAIYQKKRGYKIESGSCLNSACSLRKFRCLMLCTANPNCKSVSYRQSDKKCLRHDTTMEAFGTRVLQDSQWDYYGPAAQDVLDDDWILVFRAASSINVMPSSVWDNKHLTHNAQLNTLNPILYSKYPEVGVTTHYRTSWIDKWAASPIEQVSLRLYKNGEPVVQILFNGTGSTDKNWISVKRLLRSNFVDLDDSLDGLFAFSCEPPVRKFCILKQEDLYRCHPFRSWMYVLDQKSNICGFEKFTVYPVFLYAPVNHLVDFSSTEFEMADVMSIFIKLKQN